MRLWFSITSWGLVNFCWRRTQVKDQQGNPAGTELKWGIHLLCFHWDQWHWGRDDNEYDQIATYWGLGPLGFVSRLNW